LYEIQGLTSWAQTLNDAADAVSKRRYERKTDNAGAGIGGQFLEGTIAGLRMLAPIAAKALIPIGMGF